MKITIKNLREHISAELTEDSVNFWDSEYHWNARRDTVDDMTRGALKWYGFSRSSMQLTSPADPKFLKVLDDRMKLFGVDDETREKVVFKLRLHKASSANYKSVSTTNLKPVK